jgi:hypothetical protein
VAVGLTMMLAWPSAAVAAQVRGSVSAGPVQDHRSRLGYTELQVTAPARGARPAADVVVFLRSKESLPIPPPTEHMVIAVEGLRFTPQVAACAVDGRITFENREHEPITVKVGESAVGPILPGGTAEYVCSAGEPEELRPVRVEKWRHAFAAVFVGASGVAGRPNDRGGFSLAAPQGTYELQLITADGIKHRRPVQIERQDVDIGAVDLTRSEEPSAGSSSASE